MLSLGDLGSIPGLEDSPGGGHGNPLQYSCLENPMDREAWWVIVHIVKKSWKFSDLLCKVPIVSFSTGRRAWKMPEMRCWTHCLIIKKVVKSISNSAQIMTLWLMGKELVVWLVCVTPTWMSHVWLIAGECPELLQRAFQFFKNFAQMPRVLP